MTLVGVVTATVLLVAAGALIVSRAMTSSAAPNTCTRVTNSFGHSVKLCLDDPLGHSLVITVGPDGNIYADSVPFGKGVGRIVKLSPDGTHLAQFVGQGFPSDDPNGAGFLAVDRAGDVYVTQWQQDSVTKFAPDGKVLTQWSVPEPLGIAVDAHGTVYIAELEGAAIYTFTPQGKPLGKIGGIDAVHGRSLYGPVGITIGPDGFLYVVDHRHNRVVKMTTSGKWLRTWGPAFQGSDAPLGHPGMVAVDSHGDIYVNNGDTPRMVELSPAGRLRLSIELNPNANIVRSTGAVAVAADGTIYTAEDPIVKRSPSGKVIARLR